MSSLMNHFQFRNLIYRRKNSDFFQTNFFITCPIPLLRQNNSSFWIQMFVKECHNIVVHNFIHVWLLLINKKSDAGLKMTQWRRPICFYMHEAFHSSIQCKWLSRQMNSTSVLGFISMYGAFSIEMYVHFLSPSLTRQMSQSRFE